MNVRDQYAGIKRLAVGTPLGRFALATRDVWEFLRIRKEYAGTKVNDQLATYYVARLCKPGATFVDIGAHIGSTFAEVRHHLPTVKIIAVEAIPDKAKHLKAKFPWAQIICGALSEKEGEVSFFVNVEQSGYSSLARNGSAVREITVPSIRLDQVVLADDVDVIKLDVEGAELGVLRGAGDLVARCRPTIMFESGPGEVLGYSHEALFDWFVEHDYHIVLPNRLPHSGRPLTKEGFLEAHEYPFRSLNYFAVAAERVAEVRERARTL
ncbi:MAG: hypothetical protein AVDCRST_MAG91-2162 [uncultured Sphingomonadaceae bacterium]|uniref:Methyltransferase FkbM domain-containing protein n=1 Tax=uncultured Sphingomonadaceae bacterium TaxID=169976 RepID=A0A6J4TDB8_9SPHN|nr:MAG: hypothetical protein AVDCRST_MAG91-2162 [uncultured Sphingomonadaceae bacterium]